jgi:hypothetical protein
MSNGIDGKRQLGKVTSVQFGIEDHGFLTLWLHIDFGGSGQGFGGMVLSNYDRDAKGPVGSAAGTDYVLRMFALFDVTSLDKIVGRYVYALRDDPYGTIVGLEVPECDGGRKFITAEWRRVMFPEKELR